MAPLFSPWGASRYGLNGFGVRSNNGYCPLPKKLNMADNVYLSTTHRVWVECLAITFPYTFLGLRTGPELGCLGLLGLASGVAHAAFASQRFLPKWVSGWRRQRSGIKARSEWFGTGDLLGRFTNQKVVPVGGVFSAILARQKRFLNTDKIGILKNSCVHMRLHGQSMNVYVLCLLF